MLKNLTLWFIPETYMKNEDELRKARYFVKACLFTAAFSLFYLFISIYFNMDMPMWAMVHDTVLIGILPLMFKKGLPINLGGNLFILFGTIGVTWTVFYTGGFESGTLFWYGVLPIASLLLVNKTSSYFWTVVCVLLVSTIGILQIGGYPFENQIDPHFVYHFNLSTGIGVVLMLFLLALVFENTKQEAFDKLKVKNEQLSEEKKRSDDLLLNILPLEVAEELKSDGKSEARDFENVTVLFTDFIDFTESAEQLSAKELVSEINECFKAFDEIIGEFGIEKIKTIGDAYMAADGLHTPQKSNPDNIVNAALKMQSFMNDRKASRLSQNLIAFDMRVGIHTGPVVAGIVGVKKFQYDIWGDTVNTASRMETNGEVNKVNISNDTYEMVKNNAQFTFESRGKVAVKGKGQMEMWFVSKVNNV